MSAERPVLPPVRLNSEAELARDALAAPLFVRAVRLARWAGPETRVGAGGELVEAQLPAAAEHLGLPADEEGTAYASEAWRLAVDTGLLDVTDPEGEGRTTRPRAPSPRARTWRCSPAALRRRSSPSGWTAWTPCTPTPPPPPGRLRGPRRRGRVDRLRRPGLGPGGGDGVPRRDPRQPLPPHPRGERRGRRARAAARSRRVHDRPRRHGRAHRRHPGAGLGGDDAPRRPVPAARTHRDRRVPAGGRGADGRGGRPGGRRRRGRRGGRHPVRDGPAHPSRPVRHPGPDAGGRGGRSRRR